MTSMRVFADGTLIAENVRAATSFLSRLRGLNSDRILPHGCGMLFRPGGSIHTFGMNFPIDVVFLDRRQIVLGTKSLVTPNRTCWAPWGTRSTLELWAGACTDASLRVGQQLIVATENDAYAH